MNRFKLSPFPWPEILKLFIAVLELILAVLKLLENFLS